MHLKKTTPDSTTWDITPSRSNSPTPPKCYRANYGGILRFLSMPAPSITASQAPQAPRLQKLPPFKDLKSSPTLRWSCQARLATAGSPAGAAAPTGARPHPRGKTHRARAFGRWSRLLVSSWCVVRPLISKKRFCHPNTKMHHSNDFKLPATCSLSSLAP